MLASSFFISTTKEKPADAELLSHQLMLRAGLIKRLGSGLYSWLPIGLRVLRKVENIVRSEMDRSGAIEVLMPSIQPSELWQESKRWEQFGPQMLKIKDRHKRDFCFGPTHEEVITDIVRQEIKSYRQIPVHFYQIQTKFRDEIRPRFGVMRAREFVMKDGYSFHPNKDSLQKEYEKMFDTYTTIFSRLGLDFRAVAADTGAIGGTGSHEFHVLADSGEDLIAFSTISDYAANVELAEAKAPETVRPSPKAIAAEKRTPGKSSCPQVAQYLGISLEKIVKTLAIISDKKFVLLLLRGDHHLNETKVRSIEGLGQFRFATATEINKELNCPPGFIGPANIPDNVAVIADRSVACLSDFVCGANRVDYHMTGLNFGRDLPEPNGIFDIRNVTVGDPSPDGNGVLKLRRGIEVGHIFQLGTKYAKSMNAKYLNQEGHSEYLEMGCYGIGISRIVAAAIEQNNDENGILWPKEIAPFQIAIAVIGFDKNDEVRKISKKIHNQLEEIGIEVLLDDRGERPGVMFSDLDLLGIPYRITIGEKSIKNQLIEFQSRDKSTMITMPVSDCLEQIQKIVNPG